MSRTNQDAIIAMATELIAVAQRCGFVLTIETKPREPLAMGNFDMVVNVRENRTFYTLKAAK